MITLRDINVDYFDYPYPPEIYPENCKSIPQRVAILQISPTRSGHTQITFCNIQNQIKSENEVTNIPG